VGGSAHDGRAPKDAGAHVRSTKRSRERVAVLQPSNFSDSEDREVASLP